MLRSKSRVRLIIIYGIPILFLSAFLLAEVKAQSSDISTHDPVMIKQDSTYYLFSTGWCISVKSSKDMENWKQLNPVFDELPEWTANLVDSFKGHIWAPDIAKHNGTYYLYYSVSQFGTNNSAIGIATNKTLDPQDPNFRWKDHGPVVQSIPGRDMWNAIDPNLTLDEDGTPWLSFG